MNTRKTLENIVRLAEQFCITPIVDDDFVLHRDRFDFALRDVRRALDRKRPTIVCLCGSTRFSDAWVKARYDLTLAGKIVLTIGCDTKSDDGLGITPEQKVALDELHKRKIDEADEVLVLNVGGYVGASTRSEIEYAERIGCPVRYLEPMPRLIRCPAGCSLAGYDDAPGYPGGRRCQVCNDPPSGHGGWIEEPIPGPAPGVTP